MTGPAYYMLAGEGEYQPGTLIVVTDNADGPLDIVTDPRRLQPSEIIPGPGPAELIAGPGDGEPGWRLARLAPLGPVRVFGQYSECPGAGWRVDAEEPLDGLLGPQAPQIRAAIDKATEHLAGPAGDDLYDREDPATVPASVFYDHAIRCIPSHQWDKAMAAAGHALTAAGADGWWWTEGFSCEYGAEILALAARDLVAARGEWTWQEYELLTRPWQAAFGEPAHPADVPRLAAA